MLPLLKTKLCNVKSSVDATWIREDNVSDLSHCLLRANLSRGHIFDNLRVKIWLACSRFSVNETSFGYIARAL